MPDVRKSVLVEFSADEIFALVDAVEHYPEFLPWCGGANVSYRDEHRTRATIHINYRGIRQSFTTENVKEPGHSMRMGLIEGPFRKLDGRWRFVPLAEHGCKVEFRLQYEFSTKILEKLVGPVFNHIANTLVEAFVQRARSIHGSPK